MSQAVVSINRPGRSKSARQKALREQRASQEPLRFDDLADRFASVFERLRSLEREVRGEAADEPRPITPGDPGSVVVHELPDILTARKGAFVAHDRFRTRSGPPREDDRERAPVDLDNEPFVDEPGEGGA